VNATRSPSSMTLSSEHRRQDAPRNAHRSAKRELREVERPWVGCAGAARGATGWQTVLVRQQSSRPPTAIDRHTPARPGGNWATGNGPHHSPTDACQDEVGCSSLLEAPRWVSRSSTHGERGLLMPFPPGQRWGGAFEGCQCTLTLWESAAAPSRDAHQHRHRSRRV